MRRGDEGFLEWVEIGRRSEDILVLEPRKILVDEDSVAVVGFHALPGHLDRQRI